MSELAASTIGDVRRLSAKQKPSRKWQPLVKSPESGPRDCAVYQNHIYEVNVFKYSEGWVFGGGPWTLLGISSKDGEARHDWRDFQRIKNDIVGEEWEAVELYPAESRLMDPSNYYYLWCAPKIPVGRYEGRRLLGPADAIAPQRPWANGMWP